MNDQQLLSVQLAAAGLSQHSECADSAAATATVAVPGDPESVKTKVLQTGAKVIQDLSPVRNICAHLNAFHVYANDTNRFIETNHYCSHLNEDVRQCILYDGPGPNARLIGIEYMITPKLYETLSANERRYWHSHVFEVKSGMLVMPQPASSLLPAAAWEQAETAEMKSVVELYGKVFHTWQTDRGDTLPLGEPQLMTSFTDAGQFDFETHVGERDKRLGTDYRHKREIRKDIAEAQVHPDADQAWKK
ncbi:hypothetical protein BDZ88DRAFT_39533 [Geranomyces variabilis]|nr:hypothetical protein BDZ88DRAFT_39533 [Geranomyces variabilis]KAJ3138019.1 hypothetical protein HDU90_001495 [Geranomyces variabilis]